MSPQSRADNNTTTSCSNDDSWSSNSCLGAASSMLAATQHQDNKHTAMVFTTIHKIDSTSTTNTTNTSTILNGSPSHIQQSSLKRTAAHISSPKSQQFLASYGSAFLSGIFADIAETSTDEPQDLVNGAATADHPMEACYDTAPPLELDQQPSNKKARTSTSTSFSRQKSYKCLSSALAEGTVVSEVLSPSVISPSPRFNTSTVKFNDQVRELQDMAFPSLPKMPATVSATSLPHLESGASKEEVDGPSYGWFVSTDDDASDDQNSSSGSMFLPDMNPSDLAFKAITAPSGDNQEVEVQQALAADTVDDVLGDFF